MERTKKWTKMMGKTVDDDTYFINLIIFSGVDLTTQQTTQINRQIFMFFSFLFKCFLNFFCKLR